MAVRRIIVTGLMLAAVLVPTTAQAAPGTIGGTVTSPEGAALAGICVDVHPVSNPSSLTRVVTNGTGAYAATVEEGTYRLKFVDCDDAIYATEWYDDVTSFGEATDVVVTPSGRQLPAVSLARANRINGRVVRSGSGTGVANACIVATNTVSPSVSSDGIADSSGNFTVGGLPDGEYTVSARDCRDRALARSFYGPGGAVARGPDQAAAVAVGGSSTTTLGGNVVLQPQAVLAGTIADQFGNPLGGICVVADDAESSATSGTTTAADGSWRLAELLPGTWDVKVDDCRPGVDDDDRFGTVFIDPSGNASIAPIVTRVPRDTTTYAEVRLRPGGSIVGRVTGAVTPSALTSPVSDNRAAAGVCVGAVAPGTLTIIDSTITAGDGTYRLPGILGGANVRVVYFDCAGALDRGLEWYDDELLGEAERTVTVPAGGSVTADAALGDPLRRVNGTNRRDTANQLALAAYPGGADAVLLAREDNYPDALSGGPLAAALGAPILLSPTAGLTGDVIDTIRRLDPSVVYILGGVAALSPEVERQLDSELGLRIAEEEVFRFNGANRFDTAARIANFLTGGNVERAYVVEGSNPSPLRGWPDAVAVSGLAAFQQVPILLVNRDELPTDTSDALRNLGVDEVTVVGGPVAVADGTLNAIDVVVDRVSRVSGETRYDTSAAVVELSLEAGMWIRSTWIATGENFPDALVAGAVVGRDGGILQLLPGSDVTSAVNAFGFFEELADGVSRTFLLGGPVAISEASAAAFAATLGVG